MHYLEHAALLGLILTLAGACVLPANGRNQSLQHADRAGTLATIVATCEC